MLEESVKSLFDELENDAENDTWVCLRRLGRTFGAVPSAYNLYLHK